MKIVFIYPAFESLALEYLSAVAKNKGHEVVMVFDPNLFNDSYISSPTFSRVFSMRRQVIEDVIIEKPDILAFSVVTTDFPWFENIGSELRRRTSAFMIAGNVHVTAAPEAVLNLGFLDAIVRGEGEEAFADILDSIESGGIEPDIPNLGLISNGSVLLNSLRPPIQDLDSLPLPDKSIYDKTPVMSKNMYSIMASRGCPYNCTFCSNNIIQSLYGRGVYVRSRSVDNVIHELASARHKFKPRYVNFVDLTMGVNMAWLEEFAEKYPKLIGIPYLISTNPNVVTKNYAELLAKSGCVSVDIGFQTINPEKRRSIFNRNETNEQIRNAIVTLKEQGMKVGTDSIINFPDESESDFTELILFYNEVRPDSIKAYWLYYFPGTKIIDIAVEKGILTPEDADDICHGRQSGSPTICGKASSAQRNIHFLLMMLPMLPKSVVSFIVRHRLQDRIPNGLIMRYTYLIFRILLRRESPEHDSLFRQSMARYAFYIKRRMKALLFFTC